MIKKIGTPARYIAMAAPDWIEWVLISQCSIPTFVSPIATMPSRMRLVVISEVTLIDFFLWRTRKTGEFLFVPLYESICVTIDAHIFMGRRMGSFVLHCVTVSDFLSFFCLSKVTETQSARCSFVEEWSRISPFLIKAMLQRQSCFVCCCSAFVIFKYSHERMTQKWVAAVRLPIAHWSSVDLLERMRRMTQRGRVFCSMLFGSSFL